MRRIARPEEPERFRVWREANPEATWEQFKDATRGSGGENAEVLAALSKAQRWLCGYCEINLRMTPPTPLCSEVEHFHPKEDREKDGSFYNWGLDFSNLVAGCEGGAKPGTLPQRAEQPIKKNLHCGSKKANRILDGSDSKINPQSKLILDPREAPTVMIWKVTPEGELLVDEARCDGVCSAEAAQATILELNLNAPVLRRLRKAMIGALDEAWLEAAASEEATAFRMLIPGYLMPDPADGALQPFWTTIRHYLGTDAEIWLSANPVL
jgi:uncharacterized protein (TIGR02646 family)